MYPFLLLVGIFMIWFEYRINQRIINVVSLLIVPYLVIIPINNYYMVKNGFYEISESVITIFIVSSALFFCGSIIVDLRKQRRRNSVDAERLYNEEILNYYKLIPMFKYVVVVEAVTILRALYVIATHGITYLAGEEFSGVLTSGILGHIFLTIYPLIPIMFYAWLKDKKKIGFFVVTVIGVALTFLTFVKYHSIGMLVYIYLLVCLEDHKYVKKGTIAVTVGAVVFFIGNYFIGFFLRGVSRSITSQYYFNHLWNYLGGSLIYDNRIFESGVRVGISIFYKLGSFIFPPVNVFLNKLFGFTLCPHETQPHYFVGTNREVGNVTDAFGYLYPSHGEFIDLLCYGTVILLLGMLFTFIYNRALKNRYRIHCNLAAFLTFFVFFSFFGTFYINFVPWEILLWSAIIPMIFDKRVRIRIFK